MIISETLWMNQKAISVENDTLRIVVLPSLGGKTVSLYHKDSGFEFAAQNERGHYPIPTPATLFKHGDASGIDEAFPTVDKSSIIYNDRSYTYTDHGEIWRSAFNHEPNDHSIVLRYSSSENPYSYTKTISLNDNQVTYHYLIQNTGSCEWPCMWTFHGLFRYEEDMILHYPANTEKFLNAAPGKLLGKVGNIYHIDDTNYSFRGVPLRSPGAYAKYYCLDKVTEGKCGYTYPSQKMQCLMEYDAKILPYLGFWVTAGGYRGDCNCALEPSTSFYDAMDIAQSNDTLYLLKPQENLEFTLTLTLKKTE